jgi:hypothetical protein
MDMTTNVYGRRNASLTIHMTVRYLLAFVAESKVFFAIAELARAFCKAPRFHT